MTQIPAVPRRLQDRVREASCRRAAQADLEEDSNVSLLQSDQHDHHLQQARQGQQVQQGGRASRASRSSRAAGPAGPAGPRPFLSDVRFISLSVYYADVQNTECRCAAVSYVSAVRHPSDGVHQACTALHWTAAGLSNLTRPHSVMVSYSHVSNEQMTTSPCLPSPSLSRAYPASQ